MRYIENQNLESTYNEFQVVAGTIVGVSAISVFIVGIFSLISSL
jgi:hypothetical protein